MLDPLHRVAADLSACEATAFASLDLDEFRAIFNALDLGMCVVEMLQNDAGRFSDYVFVETNAAFERQTGLENARGRSMRELQPKHEQHWFDTYGEIAATGKPRRFTACAAALGRWYDVYAFRIGRPERRLVGILFDDVTASHKESERRDTLSREIQHRGRNQITLLMSLLRLTDADSVEGYRAMLMRRLTALSAVDLNLEAAAGCDYAELVRVELEPYQGGADPRIACAGPHVMLDGLAAQCLAIMLHELATNAVKYGALSVPDGYVSVRWQAEDGTLTTRWQESGGPAAIAPVRSGVGTGVMQQCVQNHLHGRLTFDWSGPGLACTFEVPLQPAEGLR